jgi:hypothetical protein
MLRGGQGAAITVIEKLRCVVCEPLKQLSAVLTVKLNVPAVVGIPEIKPDEFMLRPGGSDPEIMEYK